MAHHDADTYDWQYLEAYLSKNHGVEYGSRLWRQLDRKLQISAARSPGGVEWCKHNLLMFLRTPLPDQCNVTPELRFSQCFISSIREPWFFCALSMESSYALLKSYFNRTHEPTFVIRAASEHRPWFSLEACYNDPNREEVQLYSAIIKYSVNLHSPSGLSFWVNVRDVNTTASSLVDIATWVQKQTNWRPFAQGFYDTVGVPSNSTTDGGLRSSLPTPPPSVQSQLSISPLSSVQFKSRNVFPLDGGLGSVLCDMENAPNGEEIETVAF